MDRHDGPRSVRDAACNAARGHRAEPARGRPAQLDGHVIALDRAQMLVPGQVAASAEVRALSRPRQRAHGRPSSSAGPRPPRRACCRPSRATPCHDEKRELLTGVVMEMRRDYHVERQEEHARTRERGGAAVAQVPLRADH